MVDREVALIGSTNMDYRTFQLHYECGVLLYHMPAVEDLLEDMDHVMAQSSRYTLEEWKQAPLATGGCLPRILRLGGHLVLTGSGAAICHLYTEEPMSRELTPQEIAERSLIKKYRKELWNPFIAAVKRYELVVPGDRIAVCISGGKDSMVLAKLMQELQRHTEQPFQLTFLVMDPGYAPANRALIEDNAARLGIPITVFESDIFDVTHQGGEESLLPVRPDAAGLSVQQGPGAGVQQDRPGPPLSAT